MVLFQNLLEDLPITATLDDLDEKSLIKILQEPKNSLIKQYQELFKLEGVKLNFKDNAIKEVAIKAIKKENRSKRIKINIRKCFIKNYV